MSLFCLGISAVFDTKCAVKQSCSMVNCNETALFIQYPQPWVMVGYSIMIVNSIIVITTLSIKPNNVKFCGIKRAFLQLIRKGSFWSFNFTYVFLVMDYILVIKNLQKFNQALAILTMVFIASLLIVAYFLNYVVPVNFPEENERNFTRIFIWFFYWMTLVVYFLSTLHITLAVTLDVVEKLTAFGKIQHGSHTYKSALLLISLGLKATFQGRLFVFYWNKCFHGDKDLFSTLSILTTIQENR